MRRIIRINLSLFLSWPVKHWHLVLQLKPTPAASKPRRPQCPLLGGNWPVAGAHTEEISHEIGCRRAESLNTRVVHDAPRGTENPRVVYLCGRALCRVVVLCREPALPRVKSTYSWNGTHSFKIPAEHFDSSSSFPRLTRKNQKCFDEQLWVSSVVD